MQQMDRINAGTPFDNFPMSDVMVDHIASVTDTEEFSAGIDLADVVLRGRKERLGIINENPGIILLYHILNHLIRLDSKIVYPENSFLFLQRYRFRKKLLINMVIADLYLGKFLAYGFLNSCTNIKWQINPYKYALSTGSSL